MITRKMLDQGYWKSQLFYWQSMMYYLGFSIRHRSITWFSALNPRIHFGGMLDENKDDLYKIIPSQYLPKTVLLKEKSDLQLVHNGELSYPLIAKPNVGLKGKDVIKINNTSELEHLLNTKAEKEWIVQQFIDLKEEYSVLCFKCPETKNISISSVTKKVYPSVIGNGSNTLEQLISIKNDPFLDIQSLKKMHSDIWTNIIESDRKIELHQIGNYSRGSKFYNANDLIDSQLINSFKPLMSDLLGIDFCRFDLKTEGVKELKSGAFLILEMNGAKSEPLHIYDPRYTWMDSMRTIHNHWMVIAQIVKMRVIKENFIFPSTKEGLKALASLKTAMN